MVANSIVTCGGDERNVFTTNDGTQRTWSMFACHCLRPQPIGRENTQQLRCPRYDLANGDSQSKQSLRIAVERHRVAHHNSAHQREALPRQAFGIAGKWERRRTARRRRQQKVQECIGILAMPKMHEMKSSVRELRRETTKGARGSVTVLRCLEQCIRKQLFNAAVDHKNERSKATVRSSCDAE